MSKYENFKELSFPKGATIIKEGEKSDDIYIIKSGEVEIRKKGPDGSILIDVFKEGDIFGELGIIFGKIRTATVIAKTDVVVEIVNPRIISELFDTELGKKLVPIVQGYAKRLREFGMRLSLVDYENAHHEFIMPSKTEDDFKEEEGKVILKPGSQRGLIALHGKEKVIIDSFPFRVGRFSRRRSDWFFHKNELYLHDKYPFNIGRTHFAIIKQNGILYYMDYGSWHGSRVNGIRIDNPNKKQRVVLHKGENEIILGEDSSEIRLILEIRD